DHSAEQRASGLGGWEHKGLRTPKAPFEQGENGPRLLLHPLMRFVNPEQTGFEFGRAFERPNPVMRQCAPKILYKRVRQTLPVRLELTQVGKQVRLGAGRFSAGGAVDRG